MTDHAQTDRVDPAAPWESVYRRSVLDEDGQRISEWRVRADDIGEFPERSQ
jgi:hypothetical protein